MPDRSAAATRQQRHRDGLNSHVEPVPVNTPEAFFEVAHGLGLIEPGDIKSRSHESKKRKGAALLEMAQRYAQTVSRKTLRVTGLPNNAQKKP